MTPADFLDFLQENARETGDKPAIVCGDTTRSWHDFHDRIGNVASALQEFGIAPGSNVGILAESSPSYIEAFFGIVSAGATAVPLPTKVTADASFRMIRDSSLAAFFVDGVGRGVFDARGSDDPILPGNRIAFDFDAPGYERYESIASARVKEWSRVESRRSDPFNIIYSSGTTTAPKGIVHSHEMRRFQVERMTRLGIDRDAVMLLATPLYSNTTLVALLPILARGGTVILMPRFDAEEFLSLSEKHRATYTMLVPVQYRRILSLPDFGRFDLTSYRLKTATGEAMDPALKRSLSTKWPGRFVEIYGQTEGGCTTLLDTGAHPDKLHTVGRPAQGVDVRIIGDSGRELKTGQTGEVVGRAASMMTGYFNDPDLTDEATWRDSGGNPFYRTGDLGVFDEDGFLILMGREKDVIISGGFNIYPSDLEKVFAAHPEVSDVAVIGVASPTWGETPMALVVANKNAQPRGDALLEWANRRLGKTARVFKLAFLPAIPRNAAGKIEKRALAKRFATDGDISQDEHHDE